MRRSTYFAAVILATVVSGLLSPQAAVAQDYYPGRIYYYPPPYYHSCQPYYARPAYYPPMQYSAQPAYQRSYYTAPMVVGPTTTIRIGATDDYFQPGQINVQPGTTVRWVNDGKHKHTITSDTGLFDSGDLPPGESYSATFITPGTYQYYCRHHKGMQGTIVVGNGSRPAGGPTGY